VGIRRESWSAVCDAPPKWSLLTPFEKAHAEAVPGSAVPRGVEGQLLHLEVHPRIELHLVAPLGAPRETAPVGQQLRDVVEVGVRVVVGGVQRTNS
jgi:hypothetical protein